MSTLVVVLRGIVAHDDRAVGEGSAALALRGVGGEGVVGQGRTPVAALARRASRAEARGLLPADCASRAADGVKDVAKLKQGDGPALVTQGSTELAFTLLAAGLVDEIRVFTVALLLGKGKRLFDEKGQPCACKLTHRRVSPTGLISATYVRDGEVKTGSFAPDTPSAAELARRERLKREG